MRQKTIRAVILMVLLAFLALNAEMVASVEEVVLEKPERTAKNKELTAGISSIMCSTIQEYNNLLEEATIVAPEREVVKSAKSDIEIASETEVTTETNDATETVAELKEETVETEVVEPYYIMTPEEEQMAWKIAVAEAGNQGLMGMVYVTNSSINNAKALNITLLEEYNKKGRYVSVIDGAVYIVYTGANGAEIHKPVTEDMITAEVKEAVKLACQKDYTEEELKKIALKKGYDESYYQGGARFFYNPRALTDKAKANRAHISVSFSHLNHVFYRSWE